MTSSLTAIAPMSVVRTGYHHRRTTRKNRQLKYFSYAKTAGAIAAQLPWHTLSITAPGFF
jgi:hypothetical protein